MPEVGDNVSHRPFARRRRPQFAEKWHSSRFHSRSLQNAVKTLGNDLKLALKGRLDKRAFVMRKVRKSNSFPGRRRPIGGGIREAAIPTSESGTRRDTDPTSQIGFVRKRRRPGFAILVPLVALDGHPRQARYRRRGTTAYVKFGFFVLALEKIIALGASRSFQGNGKRRLLLHCTALRCGLVGAGARDELAPIPIDDCVMCPPLVRL